MRIQMFLSHRAIFGLTAFLFLALAGSVALGDTKKALTLEQKRADMIVIDTMAVNGKLEMPAVIFLHDRHTKALEAMQKDCGACHKPAKDGNGKEYFSFRYMNVDEIKPDDLKAFYHAYCISCHTSVQKQGHTSGPLEAECRTCHNPNPTIENDRQRIGLDKAIHYKHASSKQITFKDNKTNCGACHHVYDPTAQSLAWGKNMEDSCRACHLPPEEWKKRKDPGSANADENGPLAKRPALDAAVHQTCVNCHFAITAQKQPDTASGPITCSGCHGRAAQTALAETSANILPTLPRLERAQPDAVLMLPEPSQQYEIKGMMRPVSFNHKFHESVNSSCRNCHHKKIASCSSCHSLTEAKEGKSPSLARIMHDYDSSRSCVGCHVAQTRKPSCAGCHISTPARVPQDSCASCHSAPVGVNIQEAENGALLKLDEETKAQLARKTVAQRENVPVLTFAQQDIPETVTIGILAQEYQPCTFPHRKIVNTLLEGQKDNRLAAVFHTGEATLCQGCHHHTPPSKNPPGCASCHSTVTEPAAQSSPPLRAAYHQRCISCHEQMNQKPAAIECVGCHKPREK